MQLRLTESELTTALAGLSPVERLELLQLLEQRALEEAEHAPDTRPPLSDYLSPRTEAEQAHYERRDAHVKALAKQRPLSDDADAGAYLQWHAGLWHEAGMLADADGFPASPPTAAPEPAKPDPRPSLPADVQRDVELSRGLERAARRTAPAEELDRLAPFRGSGRHDQTPRFDDD